ncbi:MAG: hypothetical protein A2252_11795 [Elusimicrobia bacterium RIFOXYA2_FULL_39_19]|nr:MAG: hypothetical protein A2252_11795 [Elusimicrobia bacterium RIFOXYA2_FULL_39_19]
MKIKPYAVCLVIFVFFFTLYPAQINSATYYVSTSGLDTNTGASGSPWKTIQHAVDNLQPGDTALISDGTYQEHVVISDMNGTVLLPITLKANGTNVLIDVTSVGSNAGVDIDNSDYIIIDGFRITGGNRYSVYPASSDHVTIKNCVCFDNGDMGIFTAFCNYITIENNECYGNQSSHGIYFSNSGDYPIIRGNRSHNNRGSGIHMNADINMGGDGIITGALVEKNVIYGNNNGHGGAAISLDGVQDSIVRNNLIYNNYAQGLAFFQIDGADGARRNKILNNTIYCQSGMGSRAMGIEDNSSDCIVMNNIIISGNSGGSAVEVYNSSLVGLIMDNNIIYNNSGGYIVSNNDTGQDYSLGSWQSNVHKDTNTISVAPAVIFVDVSTTDFRLSSNSQAKNIGATLNDVTDDISGKSRPGENGYDIGCYEYGEPAQYYSISGYVKDNSSTVIIGVTVNLTGLLSAATTTNNSGYYQFTHLSTGSYSIIPVKTGWDLSPAQRTYNLISDETNQNYFGQYAGSLVLCNISGYVRNSSNIGIGSVAVTLNGLENTTVLTDSSGYYAFINLSTGTYTVAPSLAYWDFTPLNYPYSPLESNASNQNFTGTYNGTVYSISGTIKDNDASIIKEAQVFLTGSYVTNALTDSMGKYEFTSLVPGNYTVVPDKQNWVFTPLSRIVAIPSAAMPSIDFTGTFQGNSGVTLKNNLFKPLENGEVTITYSVTTPGVGTLDLYDLNGGLIKTIISNEFITSGAHSCNWNGTDNSGNIVPAGIYILRFKQAGRVSTTKICIVK